MALPIIVAPEGDSWIVHSEELQTRQRFDAGGRAEAAARELARRTAALGLAAEVRIYLRNGDMAGRFLHPAEGRALALAG